MKSSQAISAFRYFLRGERDDAISIMRQIEANEQRSGRTSVASEIRRLLQATSAMVQIPNAPSHVTCFEPSREMSTLVLPENVASCVRDVIAEWTHRDVLLQHGLLPRTKIILSGPSGNGKTALANALAQSLSLPLCVADYAEMIDSHMGVTGRNVSDVTRFAQSNPCVLLFDEADSLISSRVSGGSAPDKECNRIVNQLLIGLDSLAACSLVVFATNMPEAIDSALLRRMDLNLVMPPPVDAQKDAFVRGIAERWEFLDAELLVMQSRQLDSFAECESLVFDAARRALVNAERLTNGEIQK